MMMMRLDETESTVIYIIYIYTHIYILFRD